jgi:hypothetical protein
MGYYFVEYAMFSAILSQESGEYSKETTLELKKNASTHARRFVQMVGMWFHKIYSSWYLLLKN